jgi:hypothetical protein
MKRHVKRKTKETLLKSFALDAIDNIDMCISDNGTIYTHQAMELYDIWCVFFGRKKFFPGTCKRIIGTFVGANAEFEEDRSCCIDVLERILSEIDGVSTPSDSEDFVDLQELVHEAINSFQHRPLFCL